MKKKKEKPIKYEYVFAWETKKAGVNFIGCKDLDQLTMMITQAVMDSKKKDPTLYRTFTRKEANRLGIIPDIYCLGKEK